MTNSVDYVSLGERIKQKRVKIGLTQEELAEKCDVSTSFIGHIERGTRKLSLETMYKLSRELSCSFDYLLSDSFEDNEILMINSLLSKAKNDSEKLKSFYNIIRILAENIENF